MFEHDYKEFPELTNAQLGVMQFTSPHVQITENFSATVTKVHDGDTVTLTTDFRDFPFPLRLLDIDAPELNEGGEAARDWLQAQILGKEVEVLIDPENRVGKYGRLLGSIMIGGVEVATEMLNLFLVVPYGEKHLSEVPDLYSWFGEYDD